MSSFYEINSPTITVAHFFFSLTAKEPVLVRKILFIWKHRGLMHGKKFQLFLNFYRKIYRNQPIFKTIFDLRSENYSWYDLIRHPENYCSRNLRLALTTWGKATSCRWDSLEKPSHNRQRVGCLTECRVSDSAALCFPVSTSDPSFHAQHDEITLWMEFRICQKYAISDR